jgi:DNA-binding CsgD family transcriptional regulator/tetratricopeptide (TPR) repeat protein
MVGRRTEFGALNDALATRAGLVLIAGEAGIGKTRLAREFAGRVIADGHRVVWARPETIATTGPYSVVIDMVENLASAMPSARPESFDLLHSLTALSAGTERPARQIAARLRGLLASLGDSRVAIIEDVHFADELSQAVIAHLARSARDDGTLLLATYRNDHASHQRMARLLDVLTRDRIATILQLGALTGADVTAMLEAMWGAQHSLEEYEAVVTLAEGIPFFVEELAAAKGVQDLPASLARAVLARLEPLGDQTRNIVCAAALMAGTVDPYVLADVIEVDEKVIARALAAGVEAGLLEETEGKLTFRHALTRRVLAESILKVEARSMHRSIAQAIERRYPDSDHRLTELASHWFGAGDRRRAAESGFAAAAAALDAGALEEAASFFADVLDLQPADDLRLDAVMGQAAVAERRGDLVEAKSLYLQAATENASHARNTPAALALSRVVALSFMEGDRSVLGLLDDARELVRNVDARLFARLNIEKGYLLARYFDDPFTGGELLRDGMAQAEEFNDLRLRADACEGLAWVAEFEGETLAAQRFGADACGLALRSGDADFIAKMHGNHALRLAMRGRCAEAIEHLDDATRHLAGDIRTLSLHSIKNARAWVLWRMGRPSEADMLIAELEATKWVRQYAGVVRVWAAIELDETERAHAYVDSWWAELGGRERRDELFADPTMIASSPQLEVLATLAELVSRVHPRTRVDDGTLEMLRAYDDLCRVAPPDTRLMVSLLLATALVSSGRLRDASATLDSIELSADLTSYPWQRALTQELRALCIGDHAKAVELLDDADLNLEAVGNCSDRARILREAAELAVEVGESKTHVARRFVRARSLAVDAGLVTERNRIEAAMRSQGMRPRAGRAKGPSRARNELSTREREVVALVAVGATNQEIARRLFISEGTVKHHVASALRRLELPGRAGLAAWAAKQGMI